MWVGGRLLTVLLLVITSAILIRSYFAEEFLSIRSP